MDFGRADEIAFNGQSCRLLKEIVHTQIIAEFRRIDECRELMSGPFALHAHLLGAKIAMAVADQASTGPSRERRLMAMNAGLKRLSEFIELPRRLLVDRVSQAGEQLTSAATIVLDQGLARDVLVMPRAETLRKDERAALYLIQLYMPGLEQVIEHV